MDYKTCNLVQPLYPIEYSNPLSIQGEYNPQKLVPTLAPNCGLQTKQTFVGSAGPIHGGSTSQLAGLKKDLLRASWSQIPQHIFRRLVKSVHQRRFGNKTGDLHIIVQIYCTKSRVPTLINSSNFVGQMKIHYRHRIDDQFVF